MCIVPFVGRKNTSKIGVGAKIDMPTVFLKTQTLTCTFGFAIIDNLVAIVALAVKLRSTLRKHDVNFYKRKNSSRDRRKQ